jgi:alpha-ketoglutarate-dependent 2,4-dichlorophenoxyacetate dioxygenase
MPVLPTSTSTFSHITVSKLHPTFGAEISGVDFTRPVEEEVFAEILTAIAQVGLHLK